MLYKIGGDGNYFAQHGLQHTTTNALQFTARRTAIDLHFSQKKNIIFLISQTQNGFRFDGI